MLLIYNTNHYNCYYHIHKFIESATSIIYSKLDYIYRLPTDSKVSNMPVCKSSCIIVFTSLKFMNILNPITRIQSSRSHSTCTSAYLLFVQPFHSSCPHLLLSSLNHPHHPHCKSRIAPLDMHHLVSVINFRIHSVSLIQSFYLCSPHLPHACQIIFFSVDPPL